MNLLNAFYQHSIPKTASAPNFCLAVTTAGDEASFTVILQRLANELGL
ncbi:hypothetical protein QEV69_02105 [Trueperella pyogenes]|nr:hypothetical protein [Trueperella pyogenes]UVJ59937.1 hypothetical protein M5C92_00950 [Trueperella pyogenes]WHU58633.1 hypothetical protein QEV21_08050 [Trueperella pyogenes]